MQTPAVRKENKETFGLLLITKYDYKTAFKC